MTKEQLKNLTSIFKSYPEIKLVYFFGSRAKGLEGPMSDYDFAVYFDEKNKKKMFDAKFVLIFNFFKYYYSIPRFLQICKTPALSHK